jgi:MFS family permease
VSERYLRGIYLRLAGAIMLVVVLALSVNAFLSHRAFESALAPAMAKKVATVGASIRALVLRAVDNRIDFRELYGVEQKFDEVKAESPELSSFAITDTAGRVLHQRLKITDEVKRHFASPDLLALVKSPDATPPTQRVGDQYIVSLPIHGPDGLLGTLHLGVDARFVDNVVLEMLYDVLVVLVVALFFTLELLHFIAGVKLEASLKAVGDTFGRGAAGRFATPARLQDAASFGGLLPLLQGTLERVNRAFAALERDIESARRGPAHERPPGLAQAQAGVQALAQRFNFGRDPTGGAPENDQLPRVRAPLFLFILAEELTRSFLPAYVGELQVPIPGLSPQIVVGLPIALFMLIVAVSQPYFGVLCERMGQRRMMFSGAAVAAVGFIASALAVSVLDLLLWRSLCAVGYAMVFVAGQAYVLEHAGSGNRARSFAMFVGAIMVATVCGPSIGGILADNIGERLTFGVAAVLALGSLLAIRRLPDSERPAETRAAARVPKLAEIGTLLANRRFLTVTALAAVPAKILLTSVCFYLVPLYVLAIGSTQAMAGRVLMTYAVMMVVLAPLTASWATSRERMEWLVGGGLLLSGLGGLMLLAGPGVGWVFAAVVLVGVGQSLSISAQSALVGELCGTEVARLGEGAVYGVYRLLERLGNAIGPILAGGLVMLLGYRMSFVAIGAGVAACGVLFVLATRRSRVLVVAAA